MNENALYLLVFLWGVGSTLLGIWLSWQNNFKYNTQIIELLEQIKNNTERDDHGRSFK